MLAVMDTTAASRLTWKTSAFRAVVILLFTALLSACGGGSYAPVSDRTVSASKKPHIYTATHKSLAGQNIYRVEKGDTLYAIAFRYGKDFQTLARANGIDSNYKIYPGQLINLSATAAPKKSEKISSNKPIQEKRNSVKKKSEPAKVASVSTKVAWAWPLQGKIIQRFSEKGTLNKGINIAAEKGKAVKAAAAGEVVYAGSGLLGYGNLVIIKHNNQFLSAYAHNSKLLVEEKDRIKRGAKIAEVGDSGATRPMLHFEIRKDGKPVNPLKYLP